MAFGAPPTKETTPVQVALRVRPLSSQDRAQPRFSQSTESDVIKAIDNTVIVVPQQKSFTFDHVFGTDSTQEQVFGSVASGLVDRFIDGYNVTILAYGQTSSGKTYTMGTEVRDQSDPKHQGIIPRAMAAIFDQLNTQTPPPTTKQRPTSLSPPAKALGNNKRSMMMMRPSSMITAKTSSSAGTRLSQQAANVIGCGPSHQQQRRYTVKVSFIEIYNEELIDLLNPVPLSERPPVTIREDPKGQIYWTGVREVAVESAEDVLRYLEMGTCNRATGSTDMNAKSSRSHAIFSVTLWQEKWMATPKTSMSTAGQHRPCDTPSPTSSHSTMPGIPRRRSSGVTAKTMVQQPDKAAVDGKWVISNSKFHFVDLAGSERLKRTAAEGDRRKEGININAGLLALGNVISALADAGGSKRAAAAHIPYRDSKLTRLLQDSLGGNATTLMIACISPAGLNLTETVNTVKYAHRARHIKNKVERNEAEEWLTNDNPEFLRGMIARLKDQVRTLRTPNALSMTPPSPRTPSFSTDSPTTPTCSSSATTNITVPDDLDMILDLRRQIEKLQQQVQEKCEIQPASTDLDFRQLVEPVIEEYEKAVSSLESELAQSRAALDARAIQQESGQLKAESGKQQARILQLEAAIEEERSLRRAIQQKEEGLQNKLKRQQDYLRSVVQQKEHAFRDLLAQKEKLFQDESRRLQISFQDAVRRQDQTLQTELQRTEQEAYRWRLEDLERAQKNVATLQQIQEKQDQIINELNAKMGTMEAVIFELQQQLAERGKHMAELNRGLSSLWTDRDDLLEHTHRLVKSLEKQESWAAAALEDLQSSARDQVQHVNEDLVVAHEAALAQVQAEHAVAMGAIQAELAEAGQQNKDQSQLIGALETSLEAIQIQLDTMVTCDGQKAALIQSLQGQLLSQRRLTTDTDSSHDSGLPDKEFDDNDIATVAMTREEFRRSMTTEQVLDKLMQTMAESSQLSVQVNDLESQLELQHHQHTLENKELELKLIKLSAANDRLEKEATSILPPSLSSHQLEHNASPPQTPQPPPMSVLFPPRPTSLPPHAQQQQRPKHHHTEQKRTDRDSWPLYSLKKSGSALTGQQGPGDDIIVGATAATISAFPRAAMIRRVRAQSAAIEAPPSAPPSNPLPPVPSPARSLSTPVLTSSSISDVISSSISGHFSAEQYEKIIRSLQRKVQMADEDVLAHQQVISKLETQLSRSENSARHVRRQLETAEQEKQTYVLEIEHLRAHEAEHGQQEQQLLQDLAQERMLKDKAEKARHILEHRMEEILCSSKRTKFMCF